MFARRQFEQGDCLSHLTLRARHTMQLRNFGADVCAVDVVPALAGAIACLSDVEARVSATRLSLVACDIAFGTLNVHVTRRLWLHGLNMSLICL